MVTDSLVTLWTDVLLFFLGEMEPVEMPEWITSIASYTGTVYAFASSMGVWFNWGLLAIVLSTLFVTWIAAFVIKLVRIVASFLTLGGGSAA